MGSTGKRILIIDDSKSVHAFLRDCLAGAYELSDAFDGLQGVEMATAALSNPYNLILLDWEMPKMTGVEAFQKMRANGVKTPVIMVTSKSALTDISMMLDHGVTEYVMKPFTRDIILEKVESVLANG